MSVKTTWIQISCMVVITLTICASFFIRQGKEAPTFYGDALGYYSYLPSIFIYHNLHSIEKFSNDQQVDSIVVDYFRSNERYSRRSPKGIFIIQYTYGVALMEAPFFCLAHTYEIFIGGHPNGYGKVYSYTIKFAMCFYAFLGLFFLYLSLRKYFSKAISLFTICILLLGTNLFWFSFMQAGMSHVILFFLYSLLIYKTIQLHELLRTKDVIITCFICGLITVTRPSDIICILIPFLYNSYSIETFKLKFQSIKSNRIPSLFGLFFFFIPILPQLIYWKIYSGQFLYNSYIDQSFNWLHPEILKGLFGFSNGWLAYSPLMILSIIGLLFYKPIKPFILPILIILPLYIYIIYSWWCYNYINGFGSRPMIHLYPMLAFPLAAFLHFMSKKSSELRFISCVCIFIFISINLSFCEQAARGDLHTENSNWRFNLSTLYKLKLSCKDLKVYDLNVFQPDEHTVQYSKTITYLMFNDSVSGKPYYIVRDNEEYPKLHARIIYSKALFADACYIKCGGIFYEPSYAIENSRSHLMVIEIKRGDSSLLWKNLYVNNKVGLDDSLTNEVKNIHLSNLHTNKWGNVSFFLPIPSYLRDGDEINVNVLNLSKNEFWMKEMRIELFENIKN